MAPAFQLFSVLGEEDTRARWTVDFLLPNGVMTTIDVHKEMALGALKEELWRKAQEFPLHSRLKGKNSYVFCSVNQMAERVTLEDEQMRLCDVGLFQPLLKVEEKKKDNEESKLKAQISTLIGKGVHEFDTLQSIEVSNFRVDKKKMCERIARERDAQSWLHRVQCMYPPNVVTDPDLFPGHLSKKINKDNNIQIRVSPQNAAARYTFHVAYDAKPETLISMMLRKQANTSGDNLEPPESYCLKTAGREDYLLGEYQLIQYNCVRMALGSDEVAQLILVKRDTIMLEGEPPKLPPKTPGVSSPTPHFPPLPPRRTSVERSRSKARQLWSVDPDDRFQITIQGISNVQLPDYSKVQIRACVYHGLEMTGENVNSMERLLKDGCAEWNEPLTFDLPLPDLPRMARLCFLLYVHTDRRKDKKHHTMGGRVIKIGKQEIRPIAWVNMPVFDFEDVLHTGSQTLYMWALADDDCLHDSLLNPIGTVECNPDMDEAVQLRFEFSKYNYEGQIVFPTLETVLEVAAENTKDIRPVANVNPLRELGSNARGLIHSKLFTADQLLHDNMRQLVDKDPLHELTEQEKVVIWKLRLECREYFPDSLPKVLSCVEWDSHITVALMQALLQIWPSLKPEAALELLDFRYPDKEVRRFAVKCLRQLSDVELCQYLLQLVQVLKYEPYLDCDLVNFLMEKALNNQLIGHNLFWLLRSEMHVPSVSVRFGLILEAYCYGNKHHLKALLRQVEGLKKLRLINESIKHMSHVERIASLMEAQELEQQHMSDKMVSQNAALRQQELDKLRHKHEREVSDLTKASDLSTVSVEKIRKEKLTKERVMEEMRKLLTRNLFMDSLSGLHCFLDPARILKEPVVERCKVMDSKMKPMWMVWMNQDNFGDPVSMLYKKGDDLRQDMLTLQILRIMDNIWQKEGLDLRLNAYQCLATGPNEGMINIVTEAATIATIQKKYADSFKSAFNKTCLYDWLREKHGEGASLEKALEEFTLSCAGYCVATYVLGIGDRHSDNILMRDNGQLVHIDFGHILGHFKSKMGFKRERVPFVLTADFVYLIQRGPAKQTNQITRFKQLCERAFMTLRRHSHFLITLFLMMMNTGMPELSSVNKINFLRQTLVPDMSDTDARSHWRSKYHEALRNSFWSSVNFAFHNYARDNK